MCVRPEGTSTAGCMHIDTGGREVMTLFTCLMMGGQSVRASDKGGKKRRGTKQEPGDRIRWFFPPSRYFFLFVFRREMAGWLGVFWLLLLFGFPLLYSRRGGGATSLMPCAPFFPLSPSISTLSSRRYWAVVPGGGEQAEPGTKGGRTSIHPSIPAPCTRGPALPSPPPRPPIAHA